MNHTFSNCRNAVRMAANQFETHVLTRVATDRVGFLTADQEKDIAKEKTTDCRGVRLMTISGKGGHSADPARAVAFAESQNVSLLDHLMSVARGAAFWSVLWLTKNRATAGLPEPTHQELVATATLGMALGFMHDVNKISGDGWVATDHLAEVSPAQFECIAKRYGIDTFLADQGWLGLKTTHGAEILRALVMASEVGQAPVHLSAAAEAWVKAGAVEGMQASLVEKIVSRCVRWADRMDGAWLKGGAEALLDELDSLSRNGDSLDKATLGEWGPIEIRDPHHPFLLDAMLVAIEKVCEQRIADNTMHAPPLVGVHHDGVLLVLVPKEHREAIIHAAIVQLGKDLPFGMTLNLNARKGFNLEGKLPAWDDLVDHWIGMGEERIRQAQSFFEIHETAVTPALWATWGETWSRPTVADLFGTTHLVLPPQKAILGKYVPFIPQSNLRQARAAAHMDPASATAVEIGKATLWQGVLSPALALICVLLLNPKSPKQKNAATMPLSQEERRAHLLAYLAQHNLKLPEALPLDHSDSFTRAVALAFGAVTLAVDLMDREPEQGTAVLRGLWDLGRDFLEGTPNKAGLLSVFSPPWQNTAVEELKVRLLARVEKRAIVVSEMAGGHRCIFLDEPLAANTPTIGSEFGLYGVKMTAFSGRSGRPDHLIGAPRAGANYISALSRCEHALRGEAFKAMSGKGGGIPILASSPLRVGLFAGARHKASMEAATWQPKDVSTYDVLRAKIKEGQINLSAEQLLVEDALPMGGYRLSRYEDFPARLEDQIAFLLRWAEAAYRFGRPVHLFRGLAHPSKAFFAADALPEVLRKFLGGHEWRLEALPVVIQRLRLAAWIFDKKSQGPGGQWFPRLVDGHTNWLTAAFIQSIPGEENRSAVPTSLTFILKEIFMSNPQGSTAMTELARLAASFQLTNGAFYKLSNADKSRSFDIAYDAWKTHHAKKLSDVVPLDSFIAGELTQVLARKNALLGGAASAKAVLSFAQQFVTMATPQLMTTDLRRAMTGAYVYCFGQAINERFEALRLAKPHAASSPSPDLA
jgi:hypothetical protein